MNTFTLTPASRQIGPGQSRRTYLDFAISNRSLKDMLLLSDFVTPLCHQWQTSAVHRSIEQLLLQSASRLRRDRVPIYVCAECGDEGCGVISAEVIREGNAIIWQDFASENDYDDEIQRNLYSHVEPLSFSWPQYKEVLISAAMQWR